MESLRDTFEDKGWMELVIFNIRNIQSWGSAITYLEIISYCLATIFLLLLWLYSPILGLGRFFGFLILVHSR
jgi:hypothetical protein